MRTAILLIACFAWAAASGAGEAPADLAAEIAELKRQVADLAKRAPLKVGIVDILRVFDELEERVDMNADLRQLKEKHDARLKELVDRAKGLEDKVRLLRPESDEAKRLADQLDEAKRDFRSYRDVSEERFYEKLFNFTRSLDAKIRTEVRAYAAEAGMDLVLRGRDADIAGFDEGLEPRMKYLELNRRIEGRNVLFSQPTFDFTDMIVKRLNDRYTREKAERRRLQPGPEPKAEPKVEPKTEPKVTPKKEE